MVEASRHDAWRAGDSYDAYMGRWSRRIAPRFLDWLALPPGLDWLDIGCGAGALSEAILERAAPRRLTGVDASPDFVAAAKARLAGRGAEIRVGDAQDLPVEAGSADAVVSALMLNFVPDRGRALREMARAARPGGTIAFYVWDYPGGGMGMIRAFWTAAVALDPEAAALTEDRRFAFCTPSALAAEVEAAGLPRPETAPIEVAAVFADFEDFWRPFTLGAGPAPGYCAALAPERRAELRDRLEAELTRGEAGAITLPARAWALRTRAPDNAQF